MTCLYIFIQTDIYPVYIFIQKCVAFTQDEVNFLLEFNYASTKLDQNDVKNKVQSSYNDQTRISPWYLDLILSQKFQTCKLHNFRLKQQNCFSVLIIVRPATLLKKRLGTGVFLWILSNFYKNTFSRRTPLVAALIIY